MDEEIFSISVNIVRARSLVEMAIERFEDIRNEKKPYKIVEEYYEIIKELMTALMYSEGLKTLSHKALIRYLDKNYSREFTKGEIILADDLRKLRNDITYYGKRVSEEFLVNNEEQVRKIIKKLIEIAEKKCK